jgi:hypothetical protein
VRDRRGSKNSDENRRRRSIHLTGYQWRSKPPVNRSALLFTCARAADKFRQLRPEVGEEPQEGSTILKLGLGFISSEVIVDPLESGLCSRTV